MKALEHRIPPPIIFALVGLTMWAAARLLSPVQIDGGVRIAAASFFVLFGAVIILLSFRAFGRAKTTANPVNLNAATTLVTGGVYSFSRNPMYLSLSALLVGWTIYLAVPWLLLGPVAFVVIIGRLQIIPEERVMLAKFGTDYTRYCGRVRRWL